MLAKLIQLERKIYKNQMLRNILLCRREKFVLLIVSNDDETPGVDVSE